jgi:hypothetical protein
MTGVSSQRPRRLRDRRVWANIHTASANATGGHTQLSDVMAASSGVKDSSARPVTPIVAAGTKAQRCGRFV